MGNHTARGLSVDEAAGMTANYHTRKMQRTTRIKAGNRRAKAPQAPSGDDYKQRERARAKETKMAGRATASGGPETRPSQQSGHLRTSGAAASRGSTLSGGSGTATQPDNCTIKRRMGQQPSRRNDLAKNKNHADGGFAAPRYVYGAQKRHKWGLRRPARCF